MDITTVLYTVLASIFYMLMFFLPKRLKDKKEELKPVKLVRTILFGLAIGFVLTYLNVKPSYQTVHEMYITISSYAGVVIIIDKVSLFIWRWKLKMIYDKYIRSE